jgi:uncharacterized membrane protein
MDVATYMAWITLGAVIVLLAEIVAGRHMGVYFRKGEFRLIGINMALGRFLIGPAMAIVVAAIWFLDLWRLIPTPDKALRVREATVAKLLKRHRIRRINASQVLEKARAAAIPVAPGTINAATGHLGAVTIRLDLVNRQITQAEAQLDRLTEQLADKESAGEGQEMSSAT